jgi:hypothetical protein
MANGSCVEVGEDVKTGEDYRKSSHSAGDGECVEAGNGSRSVLVRDTTDRSGPVLSFPARAWTEFLGSPAVRGGS